MRRAAKTRMVKVRTTTATLERMNMARAGWGQIGADVRRWVLGWTRRGAQTEEGVDAVPHEVVGGEEEVADGGKEGDDGQDVHDAEVADGCRAVIGLARTHQRGRFVLGKHSVHSGWKREMEKKGEGEVKGAPGNSETKHNRDDDSDKEIEQITKVNMGGLVG